MARNRQTKARRNSRNEYQALEPRKLLAGIVPGWTMELGQASPGKPSDVVVGQDNFVYATGNFEGSFDFDPGAGTAILTATPGGLEGDGFVAKYTLDGDFVWARRLGGEGNERVKEVSTDHAGNVFIAGQFDSTTADFGTHSLSTNGQRDGFVAKLDADGNFLWAHQLGGSTQDDLAGLDVEPDGRLVVSGSFSGTVDFDPGAGQSIVTENGNGDGFVASFDTTGDFQWVKTFGGAGSDGQAFVDLDDAGNVYVASKFRETIDLGSGITLTSAGDWDMFVSKLDVNGTTQWARQFSSTQDLWGMGHAADDAGNAYVAIRFDDSIDLGPGTNSLIGSSDGLKNDMFVMRLDTNNQVDWVQQYSSTNSFFPNEIEVDPTGNPMIVGNFSGTANLDPASSNHEFTATDSEIDAFALGLDQSQGNTNWAFHFAGAGITNVRGISMDQSGRVFVKGKYSDELQSPTGEQLSGSAGLDTGFLARLDVASTILFQDSFENGQWNGLWVEDYQNDFHTSTQRSTDGNYSAEVDGRATNATLTSNTIDVSAYETAELSFDWLIEKGFDSGEYLALDIKNDAGQWVEIKQLRGNVDSENTWFNETIELDPEFLHDDVQLRFRAYVSRSSEDANIDNVRLVGNSLAGPPNQAPAADLGGPYTFSEGGSTLLDASNSTDLDGTIVSYAWDLDDDGQYDDASGVTVNFATNDSDVYNVSLQVTDDQGATGTTSTTVTVNNVAPTADSGGSYFGNEGSNISLSASGSSDPGNDIASYAWDLDNDGQFDDAIGQDVNFNSIDDGDYTIGLRVTDADGAIGTSTTLVTVQNVAPTANAGGPYTVQENDSIALTAENSSDPGDDIASYAWDLDGNGSFETLGESVSFSNSIPGTYPVAVQVIDDDGASSTATVNVTVTAFNDPPTTTGIADVTVDEDATNTSIDLHAVFDDPEDADSELSYSITANSNPGLFSSTDVNAGNLVLDYAEDEFGSADLTVRAMDTGGKYVETTFNVTVNPVNDAPVATGESFDMDQDATLTIAAPGLLANDSDIEDDALTAELVNGPTDGNLVLNANGSFEYTPNTGFTGSDSFTYRANDGDLDSNDIVVSITINEVANGPNLAFGEMVSSGGWQTVTLSNSYSSMVVVASPNYDQSDVPAVVRIRNASGNSFEFAVQQATNSASPTYVSGVPVHYTVMEEGVYDNPTDGYRLEAVTFTSTITDENNSWSGQSRSYLQPNGYTNPVVVGQVMSFNDADWSVFWAAGGSRTSVPSSNALTVGKHVGEDSDVTRANETIGYFVIEATNNASIEGFPIAAGVTNDFVRGTENVSNSSGYQYNYGVSFNSKAAVVSNAGMDGGDGGWAVLYGQDPVDPFTSLINVAIDEDQIANSERKHTTEQVAYFVVDPPLITSTKASQPIEGSENVKHEAINLRGLVVQPTKHFATQEKENTNKGRQRTPISEVTNLQLAGATPLRPNLANRPSNERISLDKIKDSVFENLNEAELDLLDAETCAMVLVDEFAN